MIVFTISFFPCFRLGPGTVRILNFSKNEREETLSVFEEYLRDVMHISKGSKYSRLPRIYSFSFRAIMLAVLYDLLYRCCLDGPLRKIA